jgi:hypothetical protein
MNGELGKLGEILLLVYGIGFSIYAGWWGYILLAGRFDLVEKWAKTQSRWTQRLVARWLVVYRTTKFVTALLGIIFLTVSVISLVMFCVLLIRTLIQPGR